MMPKVIGNNSLIARVNEVQGCMYRQGNELGRLNKSVKRYKDENAKLRELVADAIPLIWLGNVDCGGCLHMRECYAGEATDFAPENCRLVVRARELGVEVEV